MTSFKLAAIQASAVPFDRDASTEKACRLIREAERWAQPSRRSASRVTPQMWE